MRGFTHNRRYAGYDPAAHEAKIAYNREHRAERKARAEALDIKFLKQMGIKPVAAYNQCEHLHVTVHWRLYARETRYEPAEYIGKAQCNDCEEWMEPEDVPAEAERKEVYE